MRVLESETAGRFERGMKNHAATVLRRAKMPGDEQQSASAFRAANLFHIENRR